MIIIEVKDSIVQNVISDDSLGYILVDWDNIEQGDEFPGMEDFIYAKVVDNIEKALTSLRINNILKEE